MSGVAGPVTAPGVTPGVTPGATPGATVGASGRRVRHDVRDGLAVMLFSAASSAGLAVTLTLLTGLGK